MTKDKYMYYLIDRCMIIACLDNILVENFELGDREEFYVKIEEQFKNCMRLYHETQNLVNQNKMNEEQMEEELNSVLLLIRQKALKQLLADIEIYLRKTSISKKKQREVLSKMKKEMQTKSIDFEYLLSKILYFRKMEENGECYVEGL